MIDDPPDCCPTCGQRLPRPAPAAPVPVKPVGPPASGAAAGPGATAIVGGILHAGGVVMLAVAAIWTAGLGGALLALGHVKDGTAAVAVYGVPALVAGVVLALIGGWIRRRAARG